MSKVQLNQVVSDFELLSTGNKTFRLSENLSKNVILYFYPKDNTPGCTIEGQNFRDHIEIFNKHRTIIVGVSRDSIQIHEEFKKIQALPFELLSDKEEYACNLFDVLHLKRNYGKEYVGIIRSTFLIDDKGVLIKEWRKVKVQGHIEQVIEAITNL